MKTTESMKSAAREENKKVQKRRTAFEGKTFEELDVAGKDALLKELGIAAKLILPSD